MLYSEMNLQMASDRQRELVAESMLQLRNAAGGAPALSRRAARRQARLARRHA